MTRARRAPYRLSLPGAAWLLVFFLIPVVATLSVSLQTGDPDSGFTLTWHFGEYADAISR